MTNDDILTLIKEALSFAAPEEQVAAKDLTIDSTLSEFGISSIVSLEMAGYVEEKLGVQFADDELAQIESIKGFVDLIRRNAKP
jgi:acyl carrier protein